MGSERQPTWTIKELGDEVARALAHDYQGPDNGQVRAVPNTRTIRYYSTIGLVDPPLEMRGRTAIYGRRHLEQLVAVKRLQARGLSLAEVQETLHRMSPRKLAEVAALSSQQRRKAAAERPPERAFWRARPVEPEPEQSVVSPAPRDEAMAVQPPDRIPRPTVVSATRIALAPGVSLTIDGQLALSEDQLGRLATLASPLMQWLEDARSRAAIESSDPKEGETP